MNDFRVTYRDRVDAGLPVLEATVTAPSLWRAVDTAAREIDANFEIISVSMVNP